MMMLSAAETQSMIRDLGGETLTYKVAGVPISNVSSGVVSVAYQNFSLDGVWTQYETKEVDGTVVKPNDARVTMSAYDVTFAPTLNDKIVRGSHVWNIVRIAQQPNDHFIDFQVRRP